MPLKPTTSLTELIGRRFDTVGLQFSHIIGVDFYDNPILSWIRLLLGVNEDANFTVLPETERGSAILGVAAHLGFQNGAYDRFFYNGAADPNKFLETLRAARDDSVNELPEEQRLSSPELDAINTFYHNELLNFLDYTKVLVLFDEIQQAAGWSDGMAPQSLAFNASDPRFSTRSDLPAYYGEEAGYNGETIRAELLDDAFVRAHPVFKQIKEARAAGEAISDDWLVTNFPELSRVIYPASTIDGETTGEIAWATREGEEYLAVHADILAREAVLSGLIALRGGVERVSDYPAYTDVLASDARGLVTAEFGRVLGMLNAEKRAAALNGNALFDGLIMDDEALFTGLFDNVFAGLNGTDILAYRQANSVLAAILATRAAYIAQFAIADNGTATFGTEPANLATRLAQGAAAKTYAVTKTIIAEGRYGLGSADFTAWQEVELALDRSFAFDLDSGGYVTIALSESSGYYRIEGSDGVSLSDLFSSSTVLETEAPADSLLQRAAGAVRSFSDELERVNTRLQQGLNLVGLDSLGESVAKQVQEFLAASISGPVEFIFGSGATVAQEDNEVLVGFDQSTLLGNHTDNILVKFGTGEVRGGGGSDVVISLRPIEPSASTGSEHGQGGGASGSWEFGGFAGGGGGFDGGGASGSWDAPDPGPGAANEATVILDGGTGDDWVIAFGGKNAETRGGLGRDWIYNTSSGGLLYGDTVDGLDPTTNAPVEDSAANADNFWFAPNTTIVDAQHHDVLRFFGIPLVGGNAIASTVLFKVAANSGGGVVAAANVLGQAAIAAGTTNRANGYVTYYDDWLPFITYRFEANGEGGQDLLIENKHDIFWRLLFGEAAPTQIADATVYGTMRVRNVDATVVNFGFEQILYAGRGDLGMTFQNVNPLYAVAAIAPLYAGVPIVQNLMTVFSAWTLLDTAFSIAASAQRLADNLKWSNPADPLIIDLDGDGIETISIGDSSVYFDVDGDLFAERTGWLKGDDGFLVLDANGNGRIDDISEMFGGVGASGFAELATLDANGDGKITVADAIFADLRIWQDKDRDGVTDAGELKTLSDLGIVSLDVVRRDLDVTTPQGARLVGYGDATFANGITRRMFDAIFASNDTDTKYAGETGRAPWQAGLSLDAKGFGTLTDLSVAMANDVALGALAADAAAEMTSPDLRTLVAQAGDVLGKWGQTLELTRELAPVLVGTRSTGSGQSDEVVLLDRGVYVEDSQGGYWTLASGAAVVDAQGAPIARASLADVLAQSAQATGGTWRLEQMWSPSDRAAAVQFREEAPYLVQVANGRAVILDYGVKQTDGTWKLASDPAATYASKAAITALARPAGAEWRVEEIGFNPYADLPVDRIGVRFTDGQVVDYTVQVTDSQGTFHVWARNLDRALQLEFRYGDARPFELRNYAIDFETLDEVNSSDDSTYRVEMLTPAQFHFATSLGGIDFRPEMLSATLNDATGHLAYAVGPTGSANLSTDPTRYVSGITAMIDLLQPVMEQYIVTSRRFAVRMALQGGLKDFAQGIEYDVASDSYRPTTDRELAPLFKAIFEGAPTSNANDAVADYLADWNEILWQIYPDYKPSGENNLLGGTVAIDQAFIIQMMLPAFETVDLDLDVLAVANALSIDETRIVTHGTGATAVDGTGGTDFFYMTGGNQTLRGGEGADYYFVGRNAGADVIHDVDDGDNDEVRFTDVASGDVTAIRDGQDLILEIAGRTDTIRITDQFRGELNDYLTNGKQLDSGVNAIVFADGTVWDRFRMAMEVVDKAAAERNEVNVLIGSGSADILWGGKGNDFLSGGAGGDFYIYQRGDGQDVIDDEGSFSLGPVKAGIDFLRFRGDITASDLKLTREGASDTLKITLLDEAGNATSDTIEIVGQFGGVSLGLGLLAGIIGSSEGLDYVAPNLIERLIFEDGTSLEFTQIVEQVLRNARTEGDDAIYGLLNPNTLDGGAGNDFLSGLESDDTYVFGRGYGHDVIEDNDRTLKVFDTPQHDTLKFTGDLRWSDLEYLRAGASDTLTLRIAGTNDQVTLKDYLESSLLFGDINLIEDVVFGDGTRWSHLQLLQKFVDSARTEGDDVIYGFSGIADAIEGGAGNDRLEGLGGGDTYFFGAGQGNDTVLARAGDRVVFRNLAYGDVAFSRTARDLVITLVATGERLVMENQYGREDQQGNAADQFVFTDRVVAFTDVNPEDMPFIGTNAESVVTGSDFAEVFDSKGGNDEMIGGDGGDRYRFNTGYGHDIITDRRVRATWGDRRGIVVPVRDVVEFGNGIVYEDLAFTRDGDDLLITVQGHPGDSLRIRNQFRSLDTDYGVERFEFHDGRILSIADIEQGLQIAGGNAANNRLVGQDDRANVLDGRQGDDTLIGGALNDTYAFSIGYDADLIEDFYNSAGDRVVFGASVQRDELIVRRSGDDLVIDLGNQVDVLTIRNGLTTGVVEQFHFADGTVWSIEDIRSRLLIGTADDELIEGFAGRDDILVGGAGSDALAGDSGNDTYRFGLGSGQDSIEDSAGNDTVELGAGIAREGADFAEIDGDLVIRLRGTTDSLAILGNTVEQVRFADGQTLSREAILAEIASERDSDGQDFVRAGEEAGAGHDSVSLTSDQSYTFRRGGGIDTVTKNLDPSTNIQRPSYVDFADYLPTDAVVRRTGIGSRDLLITFPQTGDIVRLVGAPFLPSIRFADGTVWHSSEMDARLLASLAGPEDDFIEGSIGNDTITGGTGDDEIIGGNGNDTFRFARGDGRDVIRDTDGTNTLEIRGYTPGELRISKPVAERSEILLTFEGSDEEILLQYDASLKGVDSIVFTDGTVITKTELFARTSGQGTDFDDVLTGTAAAEILSGGRGDDVLRGGAGADRYVFRRGDGFDIIDESSPSSDINVLELPDHVPGSVLVRRMPDNDTDVVLDFGGGDSIVLRRALATFAGRVNRIEFGNGAVWTSTQILAAADAGYTPTGPRIIAGTDGVDTLTGRSADETYRGGRGRDRYVYDRGGGRDSIEGSVTGADFKVLEINGYNQADARFAILPDNNRDLLIRFAGSDDEIIVRRGFESAGVTRFQFDDGELLLGEIAALAVARQVSDGADYVYGTPANDVIDAGPGNDTIDPEPSGRTSTPDNDVIVFARGDGQDTIFRPGGDTIRLVGFVPEEVVFERIAGDEGFAISFTNADDRIVVKAGRAYYWNAGRIVYQEVFSNGPSRIEFEGGFGYDWQQIGAMVFAQPPADATSALLPEPSVNSDVLGVSYQADPARIEPGAGDDLVVLTDRPYPTQNVFTIVFGAGDGHDTIEPYHYYDQPYRIELRGLTGADVTLFGTPATSQLSGGDFAEYAGDVYLKINATGEGIWLSGAQNLLQEIVFADGNALNRDVIFADLQVLPEGLLPQGWVSGNRVETEPGNQIFVQAELEPASGTTYVHAKSNGHDVIDASANWFGDGVTDRLELSDVVLADTTVELAVNGRDIVLTWAGTDGSLRIVGGGLMPGSGQRYGDEPWVYSSGIDEIAFADGEILELADLRAIAAQNGSGTTSFTRGSATRAGQFDISSGQISLSGVSASEITFSVIAGLVALNIAPRQTDGSDGATFFLGRRQSLDYFDLELDGKLVDSDSVRMAIDAGAALPEPGPIRSFEGTVALQRGSDTGVFVLGGTFDPDLGYLPPSAIELAGVDAASLSVERSADLGVTILRVAPLEGDGSDAIAILFDEELDPDDAFAFEVRLDGNVVLDEAALLALAPSGASARTHTDSVSLTRGVDTGQHLLFSNGQRQIDPETGEETYVQSPLDIALSGVAQQDVLVRHTSDGFNLTVAGLAQDGSDTIVLEVFWAWLDASDELPVSVTLDGGVVLDEVTLIGLADLNEPAIRRQGSFSLERGVDQGIYRVTPAYSLEPAPDGSGNLAVAQPLAITLQGVTSSEIVIEPGTASWSGFLIRVPASNGSGDDLRIWVDAPLNPGDEQIFNLVLEDGVLSEAQVLDALLPYVPAEPVVFVGEPDGNGVASTFAFNGTTADDVVDVTGAVSPFPEEGGPQQTLKVLFSYQRGGGNDLILLGNRSSLGEPGIDGPALFGNPSLPDVELDLGNIAPGDLTILAHGSDLLLRVAESATGAGDGGVIRIVEGNRAGTGGAYGPAISEIRFAGDIVWSRTQVSDAMGAALGTSGDDTVTTTYGITRFMLGQGNDVLKTDISNATIVYRNGDGQDIIDDGGDTTGASPTLHGGDLLDLPDLEQGDLAFVLDDQNLVVRIEPDAARGIAAGRITIVGSRIEALRFADDTVRSTRSIVDAILAGRASAGDDVIVGTDIDNTLSGGAGYDTLSGGLGADRYVWSRGDGDDVIDERNAGAWEQDAFTDTLRLTGVAREHLRFVRTERGMAIDIADSHAGADDGGRILMLGQLLAGASAGVGVEAVELDGGVILDRAAIAAEVLHGAATPFADRIVGTSENEVLEGGRGDDMLVGGGGVDRYIYRRGDGHDLIEDNRYSFQTGQGILELKGIDPAAVLIKAGAPGPNTYDSSQIEIIITESTPGAGDGGRITLGYLLVASVQFDDGTQWSRSALRAMIGSNPVTGGNDRLTGTDGADALAGLGGDDRLSGGRGGDTYLYARGDGRDVIADQGNTESSGGTADRLVISGYDPDDVEFDRRGFSGTDLIIRLPGLGDGILIENGLASGSANTVETIEFSDTGVVRTIEDIRGQLLLAQGTAGDDIIRGTIGSDIIVGGRGTDLLTGEGGADTYIYRRGDGDDRIVDYSLVNGALPPRDSATDVVELPDYSVADVTSAIRAGPDSDDLVITFAGAGDHLILANALGFLNYGVEQVRFADGTVWDGDAMRARALADVAHSGNDKVYGFALGDVIAATPGNDLLAGGSGSDRYLFATGFGQDVIDDRGTAIGDTDRLQFTSFASSQASVERLYRGSDAVVIRFAGRTDVSVTVYGALSADGRGIESYLFADGIEWSRATLGALLENHAPSAARDGFFSVVAGQTVTIAASDLLGNDFDTDGDPLRIVAVDGGNAGIAVIDQDGNVAFTAHSDVVGPVTLRYTTADDRGGFDDALIDVRIRPVASARDDKGFTVAEDGFITIRTERLLSNDLDGDRLVIGQVLGTVGGSVSLASDGNIVFTPTANFNGLAQFTYDASTPEGGSTQARVFINVTPVNDAPVARPDSGFVTSEGAIFEIDPRVLLINDSDVDGDALVVQSVTGNTNLAISIGTDGLLQVRPADFFFGQTWFDYTISDGKGGTATARATVTVTPVNDTPEAYDDRIALTQSGEPIREDNPIIINLTSQLVGGVSVPGLLDNDIERDGDVMSVVAVRRGTGGTPRLLPNQTIEFVPTANFNGEAWFDYQVTDPAGATSWARATIVYQPVNDRPVARDDSYEDFAGLVGSENTPIEIPIAQLLGNDFDIEGLSVRFETAADAINGDIAITDHGTIIFTPDAGFAGVASFSYGISDPEGLVDEARVFLYFEDTASAPPVAAPDTLTVNEDGQLIIPFAALVANDSDPDGDPLRFLGWSTSNADWPPFSGSFNGTLEVDGAGNLVFTPDRDATGTRGFTYRVTDDRDGVTTGFVSITIIPSNDDPVALEDAGFVSAPGVPLVLRPAQLLENDYDIEQMDRDGDGIADWTLPDPARPRPTLAGLGAVLDSAALALGNRVSVGTATLESASGENYIVVRYVDGFLGEATLEYTIADSAGLTDLGFVRMQVSGAPGGDITGTTQADYLIGSALGETIAGLSGDDRIAGEGGNDVIRAGDGDDTVLAGDGDDIIDGGLGADTINGGAGFDTVRFDTSTVAVSADLESRIGQGGTAQGDEFFSIEALVGTLNADRLGGDGQANRLEGLAGNDLLEGRGGADTLLGGAGNDTLRGGEGADLLDGGDGSDTADYSQGAGQPAATSGVTISLAQGTATGGDASGDVLVSIENVIGSDLADAIEGDDAGNRLAGGRGDDILRGLGGDDWLSGGRGADQLIGGDGTDTASYVLSDAGIVLDLADGSASSGEAVGDTLESIEIVEASYHDDILRGDAADNRLRGSRGADVLDGRGGFDTADYATADEGVAVDLGLGVGTAGEAAGDSLAGIEKLVGSLYADTFVGSSGNDTFDGNAGGDDLRGGAGSDNYIFGRDSGQDLVTDIGSAADIDRVVLATGIGPRDVSLQRDGDDLLIELERETGNAIDVMRIAGHFVSEASGIEEIAFADGMVWDRARIETLLRVGSFNAEDDFVQIAREDEPVLIDPVSLFANDASEGLGELVLVSLGGGRNGQASLTQDGSISFLGAQDFNGYAFFEYTVRDAFGRESTAEVRVNLAPVNDAPVAGDDGVFVGQEDEPLVIALSSLLANDSDIDGDQIRIVSIAPLRDVNGNEIARYDGQGDPGTNVSGSIQGNVLVLNPRTDHFGFAGFSYVLEDSNGARSTGSVELFIAAVNDAPRSSGGTRSIRLEQTATITVEQLLAQAFDIEGDYFASGDRLEFLGLAEGANGSAASNGTAIYDAATRTIAFTPDSLGNASLRFNVRDARGAAATLTYAMSVRPLNDPPRARNDYGLRALEDAVLVIDPATLLANDGDENGDTLIILGVERFADNGKVRITDDGRIEFRPKDDYNGQAGFEYTISDGRGGFSTAYVAITVMPRNDGPVLRGEVLPFAIGDFRLLEDGVINFIAAEAFANDTDPQGDVLFFQSAGILGAIDTRFLSADYSIEAKSGNNTALPEWLTFDPATMTFAGIMPAGLSDPVDVVVFLRDPQNGATHAHRFSFGENDANALAAGYPVAGAILPGYTLRGAFGQTFEFGAGDLPVGGTVTAAFADGSAVPSWLIFDASTLTFTGDVPADVTEPFEVELTFTAAQGAVLTRKLAINPAELASGVSFDSDIAVFDLGEGSFSASLANGGGLPDWLAFDAATMTLGASGFDPDADAGAVRVRIAVDFH